VIERERGRERERRSDFPVHFSPYDLRFIVEAFLKGPCAELLDSILLLLVSISFEREKEKKKEMKKRKSFSILCMPTPLPLCEQFYGR
jgi:hypothetical protein